MEILELTALELGRKIKERQIGVVESTKAALAWMPWSQCLTVM